MKNKVTIKVEDINSFRIIDIKPLGMCNLYIKFRLLNYKSSGLLITINHSQYIRKAFEIELVVNNIESLATINYDVYPYPRMWIVYYGEVSVTSDKECVYVKGRI